MDSKPGNNVGAIGQPLTNLFKRIEANRIAKEELQQTPIRPPRLSRSERGSSSTPEGISASDCTVEYLVELMKEKCQLGIFPQLFPNVERLIDEEVGRVRSVLFHCSFSIDNVHLPEPEGSPVTVQEKVYVPFKEHPDYNFVGRILGPRGMTAKQLEQETGCRIMIRGRGSMRDRRKEESNRGKQNWEHLEDELHVVVQCEDTPNRVQIKLKTGVQQIMKLLVPTQEGADDLKRKQLMELAILNGTYRPAKQHKQGSPVMNPMTLMSPIGQTPTSMSGHPVFVSPVGSPITPANNNTSLLNSILHSSNVDYNMIMNQLTLDAALSSLSPQNSGDCQPQHHSSPFNDSTSLNTSPLFNPLQSYLIDPTTFTPPASANSDRH